MLRTDNVGMAGMAGGNGLHGRYGLQFTLQKPGRCKVKHAIGSLWSPTVVPMTPQVIVPIVRTCVNVPCSDGPAF
jgi:hypothetical protein